MGVVAWIVVDVLGACVVTAADAVAVATGVLACGFVVTCAWEAADEEAAPPPSGIVVPPAIDAARKKKERSQ